MRGLIFLLVLIVYLAWLGWLGWLNVTAARPDIISPGQIALAPIVVEAAVQAGPDGTTLAKVLAVLRAPPNVVVKIGEELTVDKLDQAEGWTGHGNYVLALQRASREGSLVRYQVAPVPHSPLFDLRRAERPTRVYKASPSIRAQLERIFQGG